MDYQNKNQKEIYYSKSIMKPAAQGQPLEDAVLATTCTVTYAELKTGQYGDFISIKAVAVLGDSTVERLFGKEFVNEKHEVEFQFPLNSFSTRNFIEHTPRFGQQIMFMLYNMKRSFFSRKTGEEACAIKANCAGYATFGSTKKTDGTERPPITINGMSNGTKPGTEMNSRAGVADVASAVTNGLEDLGSDDEDLPF